MFVVDQEHSDNLFKQLIQREITAKGTPNQLIELLNDHNNDIQALTSTVNKLIVKNEVMEKELETQKKIIGELQKKVNAPKRQSKAA